MAHATATNNQAKLDDCNADCAYIVKNLMTQLQQLDNVAQQRNKKSKGDQSEDKDSNFEDDILDPDGINEIPEGVIFGKQ